MSEKVAVKKKVGKHPSWKTSGAVKSGSAIQGHAVVIQHGKGYTKFKPGKGGIYAMTMSGMGAKTAVAEIAAKSEERAGVEERRLAGRLVATVGQNNSDVAALCDEYGLRREELGRLTGFSLRALAEWAAGSLPSQPAKRRLHEVRRLLDSLSEIVKKASIPEWLHKQNPAFDGLTPLQVIEVGEIDRLWGMVHEMRSDQVS